MRLGGRQDLCKPNFFFQNCKFAILFVISGGWLFPMMVPDLKVQTLSLSLSLIPEFN